MSTTTDPSNVVNPQPEKRTPPRSLFEVPNDFFNGCRLIPPGKQFPSEQPFQIPPPLANVDKQYEEEESVESTSSSGRENGIEQQSYISRLTCNTCKAEFDSLFDQRAHFKSDLHRFNVKLTLAGKAIVKEEDFEELHSDSFQKDFDVSSISGSDDEDDRGTHDRRRMADASLASVKQKMFIRLLSGERVSIWKCLLLKDSEAVSFEDDQFVVKDEDGRVPCLRENDVIGRLKTLIHEPRDSKHLRVMLMARGGHFAGCVFDGNTVVAHKTFHRYVVRAKAGKRQSSKDASGRSIHSAGASLRRYNELALKKDIQDLLASWKSYFDASSCVFIHAPSSNRQLFYNGEKPLFSDQHCDARGIPFTIRRPTFKEARRIYGLLSQIAFEIDENEYPDMRQLILNETSTSKEEGTSGKSTIAKAEDACEDVKVCDSASYESDKEVIPLTTPLHDAAKSGNIEKVLELLEQGLDPTIKNERGKTPYILATDKEVRNAFRRFMASNLEKWDWHAANVPSPLTKEMEESQAAKQAEKDAKRKARAKELKKLKREKEKKAQAQAAELQKAAAVSVSKNTASSSVVRPVQSGNTVKLSKEEELKRKQAEEREKRAAAAERRLALASSSSTQSKAGVDNDLACSCCNSSLVDKVPFHRYNYKYCSPTCMKIHREFLEDGG